MRVELLLRGVAGEPLVVDATLVIIRRDNDLTPVCVSGEYGPGAIRTSHAGDKDFNDTLRKLGIQQTVICEELVLTPPPSGAKLIRGSSN